MMRRRNLKVWSTYSKGSEDALALNFGTSAGPNCWRGCAHHSKSTAKNPTHACYAENGEQRPDRQPLHAKLKRHDAMPPAQLCAAALLELQWLESRGILPDFVRFSGFGSVPMPEIARADKLFLAQFRALCKWLVDREIDVHFPAEGYLKTRFYRALVDDLICVRESAQTRERFIRAAGAVSCVAGSMNDSVKERIRIAWEIAKARTMASGRKCGVCPAITHRKKCGPKGVGCNMCSRPNMDVVYPIHR